MICCIKESSWLFWISRRKNTIVSLISDTQLQTLNLSNRGIEQIENGVFCLIEKLRHRKLSHNNLTVMPELCSLKKTTTLISLGPESNKIAILGENYFRDFMKWKFLFISFNKFQGISSLVWLDLQLTILDANKNEIRSFDEMFMGKRHSIYLMEEFHATGNEIAYFKTSYFSHMMWLKYLDLRENKLTHIANFRPLYQGGICLYDNPCGRQFSWTIDLTTLMWRNSDARHPIVYMGCWSLNDVSSRIARMYSYTQACGYIYDYYLPKFTIFGKYVRLSVCLSVCLIVCQFCQA